VGRQNYRLQDIQDPAAAFAMAGEMLKAEC
jgi:hypothetical protein